MSHWKLVSQDRTLTLDLNTSDDTGATNGTLVYQGRVYVVAGGWDASGSVPGRNFSAFAVSGRTTGLPNVPNWIAATGIMTGPGSSPAQIDIQVNMSSSAAGTFSDYAAALFPA
jgi:hypothetical protein